jgi:RHS repeat-associated protein
MALENGTSSFYHYDALGSTSDLTDASQTVTDTYRYNAWGEILARTGTTANPYTYAGNWRYYYSPDAVLYLLGLRYYAHGMGRFLTVDPAEAGANWYVYAQNAATRATDPSGLWHVYSAIECLVTYDRWWSKCHGMSPKPRKACERAANQWETRCKKRIGINPCVTLHQPPLPPGYPRWTVPYVPPTCTNAHSISDCLTCGFQDLCWVCCEKFALSGSAFQKCLEECNSLPAGVGEVNGDTTPPTGNPPDNEGEDGE